MSLTAQRLHEVLHYDPETGVFTWLVATNGRIHVGQTAGSLKPSGYVDIKVDRKLYKAHRLAWLYIHGEWPADELDHRDTKCAHNVISNLRPADRSQNCSNVGLRQDNTSGAKGVALNKLTGRWVAYSNHQKRRHHLGTFSTFDAAVAARTKAANDLHAEFARAA